ncbi:MAG: SDR family NAD(P)-dependent oxidoreductase [Pseudomonadota bacterium]
MADETNGVALIVGAGAGLGGGLGRRFAAADMGVALASRNEDNATRLAGEVAKVAGSTVRGYGCDATNAEDVTDLFDSVTNDLGDPDVVVYNASGFLMKSVLEIDPDELAEQWEVTCLGGFLIGREAARRMVERENGGTIIFTGATACYKGSANFAGFAVGKFGLRALAQSMARELGPRGVHVALVNIDGEINGPHHAHEIEDRGVDAFLDTDAIAETYYALHRQHPTAWTHELDLRPAIEKW